MSRINILPNGTTCGNLSGGNKTPLKRKDSNGWTLNVSKRLRSWLYSIPVESLTGNGISFTLTVKDCPSSSSDWSRLRSNFIKRLFRDQCIRLQWLTEWQERGVPHLHGVAYFENQFPPSRLIDHWLDLTSVDYSSSRLAQDSKPINNVLGWLDYLAKHSARSSIHYQRSPENVPVGWLKTGRMWGYRGSWDKRSSLSFEVEPSAYYIYRRISRKIQIANARQRLNDVAKLLRSLDIQYHDDLTIYSRNIHKYIEYKRSLSRTRGLSKCSDRDLSHMRGLSTWINQDHSIQIINYIAHMGYKVFQV